VSKYRQTRQASFPKAKDRFESPTKLGASPAPDKYQPQVSFEKHISSTFKNNGGTKIGLDSRDKLGKIFNVKGGDSPGPGFYAHYSDFGKYDPSEGMQMNTMRKTFYSTMKSKHG
jgi:hypothetical protein